jgi:hypothetical protein
VGGIRPEHQGHYHSREVAFGFTRQILQFFVSVDECGGCEEFSMDVNLLMPFGRLPKNLVWVVVEMLTVHHVLYFLADN